MPSKATRLLKVPKEVRKDGRINKPLGTKNNKKHQERHEKL